MIEIEDMRNGTYAIAERGGNLAFTDSQQHAERIKRALERESMVVVWFEATPEQDKAIEDVLDVAAIHFAATEPTRTETLVSALTDWRQRLAADDCAKEDGRTRIILRLDADDYSDIMAAVERRKQVDCDPDSDSCALGTRIAEICRGWMERVEHDKQPKPTRTDNGDNTVTFHGIDATVRADVLEGRDVLAVRSVRRGESFLSCDSLQSVTVAMDWAESHEGPRIIVGCKTSESKPQPPAPAQKLHFREGGFYRDTDGQIHGPLHVVRWSDSKWSWMDEHERTWHPDGLRNNAASNLCRGEVIVWRHPGLRAGEYWWDGQAISLCQAKQHAALCTRYVMLFVSDWTDPPRVGKWLVRDGQEYATWEGE